MYRPVLVTAGCAALIVGGLALSTVAPLLGTVVAVAGMVLSVGLLAAVFLYAWHGDQKRAWGPGSLYREYRDEQTAKRK